MSLLGKLLIGLGIIVGVTVLIAVGITGYMFGELRQHGVSIGSSYSDEHEYHYVESQIETIDAYGKESLLLKNGAGSVEIIGWDGNSIEIKLTKKSDMPEKLQEISLEVDTSGPEVRIVSSDSDDVNNLTWVVDFVIKVPRSFGLDVNLGVGNLHISDFESSKPVIVDVGLGQVEVVDVAASEVNIDLGVGDLFVKNIDSPTSSVKLGIGELDVRLMAPTSLVVDANVGVGELAISGLVFPVMKVEHHGFLARSAHIELGDSANLLKLEVGMGELRLIFEK